MKRDSEAFLDRLTPAQRATLRKIAQTPGMPDLLAREIEASIVARQTAYKAEKAAIETAAIEKATGEIVQKMHDMLSALSRKIDAIQKADRQRAILAAANVSYWKNGHLHHSAELFEKALHGEENDEHS
jgi:hypothetical protein